jgi:hypothetical protein
MKKKNKVWEIGLVESGSLVILYTHWEYKLCLEENQRREFQFP